MMGAIKSPNILRIRELEVRQQAAFDRAWQQNDVPKLRRAVRWIYALDAMHWRAASGLVERYSDFSRECSRKGNEARL